MSGRTFENNGRQIQENLIDPGVIPDETPLRHQQKAMRQALHRSQPGPMRDGRMNR